MVSPPTPDEIEDLMLSSRFGDLQDIQSFIFQHGLPSLADARDDQGNTVLHMLCANGYLDILNYLLPSIPVDLISMPNLAGNTPLHWAAVNSNLGIIQALVEFPQGPGPNLIDAKNILGRTPLGEAEHAGWEEGSVWMCKVMNLEDGEETKEDSVDQPDAQAIEFEIEDAEGRTAKMSIPAQTTCIQEEQK